MDQSLLTSAATFLKTLLRTRRGAVEAARADERAGVGELNLALGIRHGAQNFPRCEVGGAEDLPDQLRIAQQRKTETRRREAFQTWHRHAQRRAPAKVGGDDPTLVHRHGERVLAPAGVAAPVEKPLPRTRRQR